MKILRKKIKGFTLLYALLLTSIVLTIVFGISNILLRQIVTASIIVQGESASLAAQAGVNCVNYWELYLQTFGTLNDYSDAPKALENIIGQNVECAGKSVPVVAGSAAGRAKLIVTDIDRVGGACVKIETWHEGITHRYISTGINPGNATCDFSITGRQTGRVLSN